MPALAWEHAPALLLQFVIGGAVVAGMSALAARCSSKDAALLCTLPITYVPILVYVWRHAQKEGCALILSNFVGQSLASNALLLLFCLALYFMVSARTPSYHHVRRQKRQKNAPHPETIPWGWEDFGF